MLFFIHIPKTAGTSLRAGLESAIGSRLVPVYPGKPGWRTEDALARELPADAVLFGHFGWGLHRRFGASPSYATILRDPVERVASWYRHVRSHPHPEYHADAKRMSLAEMAEAGYRPIDNDMTARLAGVAPKGPDDREPLALAKQRLAAFAFVGSQETLAADLPRLARVVGADLAAPDRLNVGKPAEIADADRQAVRRRNWSDIELHRYALALRQKQVTSLDAV